MEYGKKTRIGGFELLKVKKGEMTFIRVGTIMGNWSMEYREDSVLFHFLDSERTREQDDALQVVFVNAFMAATLVESDYQHELLEASGRLQERINAERKEVSDEEDAEILRDLRTEHEVMEELLKQSADGEEGGKTDAEV